MIDAIARRLGIFHLLPQHAVLGPWQRSVTWAPRAPSGVTYTSAPSVPFPLLPAVPFGLTYALDLVVVSEHPEWNMHELALIRTPQGPRWLAKDADQATLSQTLVADLPELEAWMPEVPVPRLCRPLQVHDRSTTDQIDVALAYDNPRGQPTEIHYVGPAPFSPERRRNGSTMGHSRDALIAVLDLSHKDHGKHVSIQIDGKSYKNSRILGLLPFRFALQQTQGGLCTGAFRQDADGPDAFLTTHATPRGEVSQRWTLRHDGGHLIATQRDPLRTLQAAFLKTPGERLELQSLTVIPWDTPTPAAHIAFEPALPDLRCAFQGEARSRFVIDINGQLAHCVGAALAAAPDPHHATLRLRPRAPWWTADRPLDAHLHHHDQHAHVKIARAPDPPDEPLP